MADIQKGQGSKKINNKSNIEGREEELIKESMKTLIDTYGTKECSPIQVDSEIADLYEKMTYFASAVFRGLDIDVCNALAALYPDEPNPLKHRTKLENGFSQFECTSANVTKVVKDYPNLKALFFAEDWRHGNVYLAYSESGCNNVSELRLIGSCDFYQCDRWTLIHDPSEESFEEGTIKYSFDEKTKWENCNYVLPEGDCCLAKAALIPSKPYAKTKTYTACEVIKICYPKNEKFYQPSSESDE